VNVLDLFSGIGGFSLGLERAGMRTVQFVELDPYCRAVLARHWPGVPCHDDIRSFHAPTGFADVICGGFPCQDISVAGKGAGLAGERSGLWREYARLVGEIRPRFVIVENVAALLSRGLGEVLGDLAALGYDAEWHCIPASAVGARHRRDRLWIVAYPGGDRGRADAARYGLPPEPAQLQPQDGETRSGDDPPIRADVADPDRKRRCSGPAWGAYAKDAWQSPGCEVGRTWDIEPDVGRVANGVPSRVDRLRCLGNAIVPQVAFTIFQALEKFDLVYGQEGVETMK
jgi:DNA (cytosine-5)-methyltransferase 1